MAWFKVDDALPAHHKVLSIPRGARRLAAIGSWTLGGAWTSANGKEGLIPSAVVEELGIPTRAVADLVASGLWIKVPEGYRMHDFLDYNPTAEQVASERAAAAERQRRAREKAKAARLAAQQEAQRHAVTNGVSHGRVTPGVTVPPTRPDPTRSSSSFSRDVDVELREPPITSSSTPPARPALRAVEAAACKHDDPHPELCQLCRRERRTA